MAGQQKVYNNFSNKLLEHFPKLKPGEPLRFQLCNVRVDKITNKLIVPQSSTLDAIDRIFDPWAIELGLDKKGDMEYRGDYIDIAYIASSRPASPESVRDTEITLGDIIFRREGLGMIEWDGSTRQEEAMMQFLFFCNRNESNSKHATADGKMVEAKPWHVPNRYGYIYKQISKVSESKMQLTRDKLVDRAIAAITKFDAKQLEKIKKGMFPNEWQTIDPDTLELKLRQVAVKNPEKILGLSQDADVELNAFITDCEQAGLIVFETGKNIWVWSDTKEKICMIKPGQRTKFVALKMYFMTDAGQETMEILEAQLKMSRSGKKPETPNPDSGLPRTGAANLHASRGNTGKFEKKNQVKSEAGASAETEELTE